MNNKIQRMETIVKKKDHHIVENKKDKSLSQKEEHGKLKKSLTRNDKKINDLQALKTPIESFKTIDTFKIIEQNHGNEVKTLFLDVKESLDGRFFKVTNSSLNEQYPRIFYNSSYINKVLLRRVQKQHKQDFSLHMPDDDGYFQQRNFFA